MEVLPEWEAAAELVLARGGITMVLGATDTGKSTLCRYLVYYLFSRGRAVALVDLDLGQSHLGPPASLGLGLFPPLYPGEDSIFPSRLYFIGRTSPTGVLVEVLVGCRVLVDQALTSGASHIMVNTCGFIQGPAAFRLKRAKLEILKPKLILGLERREELARLRQALLGADTDKYLGLPVSSRARLRSQEERRLYREARWRRYFQNASPLNLPFSSLGWQGLPWGLGQPLTMTERRYYQVKLGSRVLHGEADGRETSLILAHPPRETAVEAGPELYWVSWPSLSYTLTGLLDPAHDTLALGLILPSPWEGQKVTFLTPLSPSQANRVRFVRVGKMKISPEGKELTGESRVEKR